MRVRNRPEDAPVTLRPDEEQKFAEETAKSEAAARAAGLRDMRRTFHRTIGRIPDPAAARFFIERRKRK